VAAAPCLSPVISSAYGSGKSAGRSALAPGDDAQPAILTNTMHAYLVRAAAQGVHHP
jgi:hypothetical protein